MQQASSHKEWFFLLQVQCVSSFLSTWFWSLQKNGLEQAQKPKACTSRWNTFCWPCNGPPKKRSGMGNAIQPKEGIFQCDPPGAVAASSPFSPSKIHPTLGRRQAAAVGPAAVLLRELPALTPAVALLPGQHEGVGPVVEVEIHLLLSWLTPVGPMKKHSYA